MKALKIDNEMVSMFDVDETLVCEPKNLFSVGHPAAVKIVNPYDNETKIRIKHTRHIELMKIMKGRGRFVVVWSGGGVQWAEAVIKALGLEEYVDMVMTKPICYVDDYPSQQWLNNQIYLKPEEA